MTREELEAVIWRTLGRHGNAADVDAILAAADAYAEMDNPIAARARDIIAGRERLARAAAENGPVPGPAVHYPGVLGGTACQNAWRHQPRRVTTSLTAVTCNRCRRSRGYKDRLWELGTAPGRAA